MRRIPCTASRQALGARCRSRQSGVHLVLERCCLEAPQPPVGRQCSPVGVERRLLLQNRVGKPDQFLRNALRQPVRLVLADISHMLRGGQPLPPSMAMTGENEQRACKECPPPRLPGASGRNTQAKCAFLPAFQGGARRPCMRECGEARYATETKDAATIGNVSWGFRHGPADTRVAFARGGGPPRTLAACVPMHDSKRAIGAADRQIARCSRAKGRDASGRCSLPGSRCGAGARPTIVPRDEFRIANRASTRTWPVMLTLTRRKMRCGRNRGFRNASSGFIHWLRQPAFRQAVPRACT